MEQDLRIDVIDLDAQHRRAIEEVIGRELSMNQRLIISVREVELPATAAALRAQTLEDWTNIYDGLSDVEIEKIDEITKTRAKLTRDLP